MNDLQYPVGQFSNDTEATPDMVNEWIKEIEEAPEKLKEAVKGLNDEQLDTAYRPGGWTVRQVVHHLPDSHLNGVIRFKLALTENSPLIKDYEESEWAMLSDYQSPITVSISLLEALHDRWSILLRTLEPADLIRTFVHPDKGSIKLRTAIGIYAWHSRHHIAHITELRARLNW
ncbi:YfiT family bacillithiol transferase [Fictibacillus aquaticus]|uniref:Putative metal-dependent hydrolase CGZ90_01535 n=1 Tax=Fictibacillus aquaticus TaxID=2021314 RepID=A0A235FBD2_9BACL|nr:bacillithiol transferase BstA [Fictibacillus aquaticus]OYD58611.1 metal-dependent hydrolase [Fictibacillus aquaticus]